MDVHVSMSWDLLAPDSFTVLDLIAESNNVQNSDTNGSLVWVLLCQKMVKDYERLQWDYLRFCTFSRFDMSPLICNFISDLVCDVRFLHWMTEKTFGI